MTEGDGPIVALTPKKEEHIMKKELLILALLLSVTGASGQQHHNHHGNSVRQEFRHQDHRGHDRHHKDGPHREELRLRERHHRHGKRADVLCVRDWQELWNGCHVRVNQFGVSVKDRRDNRIVKGEEVILLASGDYLVRNGGFWRVYTEYGDRLGNVWGDSVELTRSGLFRCVRAGNVHWYDLDGNERRFRP